MHSLRNTKTLYALDGLLGHYWQKPIGDPHRVARSHRRTTDGMDGVLVQCVQLEGVHGSSCLDASKVIRAQGKPLGYTLGEGSVGEASEGARGRGGECVTPPCCDDE